MARTVKRFLAVFAAACIVCAAAGLLMRGNYPITSSQELEDVHECAVSLIGALGNYEYEETQQQYLSSFKDGIIVEVTPISKHQYGSTMLTTAEITKACSSDTPAGSLIRIIEPYSYSYGVVYTGLYMPMMKGRTYLVNIEKAGMDIYNIIGFEAGICPVSMPEATIMKDDSSSVLTPSADTILVPSEDYPVNDYDDAYLPGYTAARKDALARAGRIISAVQ